MTGYSFQIELDDMTLARARRGDRQACERIFRLFERPAYTLAYRLCQCPEAAQDVLQDAFINVFKRLHQFRGEAPFWGWLRRIVANQAVSSLRKRRPEVSLDQHTPLELGLGSDDQRRVHDAMDANELLRRLSAEDRTVVWLHDVEGYSHKEIADLVGYSESYSKSRLSRARQQMRHQLQHETALGACGTMVPQVSVT